MDCGDIQLSNIGEKFEIYYIKSESPEVRISLKVYYLVLSIGHSLIRYIQRTLKFYWYFLSDFPTSGLSDYL